MSWVPQLLNILPAAVAGGGAASIIGKLFKKNKGAASFVTKAALAGYSPAKVLQFLQNMNKDEPEEKRRSDLKARAAHGRPDEVTEVSRIQESEDVERLGRGAVAAAGTAAGGGLLAAGGGALASLLGGEEEITEALPGGEEIAETTTVEETIEEAPEQESFIKRAVGDADVLGLPKEIMPSMNNLTRILQDMEGQGMPWEDKRVQGVVGKIRSVLQRIGSGSQQLQQGQAEGAAPQQGGDASAQFIAQVMQLMNRRGQ